MMKIKITVIRKIRYDDLIEKYKNPIEYACDLTEGQVFYCDGAQKPQGFCDSAWDSVLPFVKDLAEGKENYYDGWMKNRNLPWYPVMMVLDRLAFILGCVTKPRTSIFKYCGLGINIL